MTRRAAEVGNFTAVVDGRNSDIGLMSPEQAKEHYLELAGDWEDPYGPPVEVMHDGVRVVRDDLITGFKCRGGHCLISKLKQQEVVYVQPRVGLAAVSVIDVCDKLGKHTHLFMPACKRISRDMAVSIERGASYEFHRIAAMPVLNSYAKKYAAQKPEERVFVPFGLHHELVTAGIVKVASAMREPEEVWTVLSTGVLSRGLQIAWPNAVFKGVMVARNMKAGEIGRISDPISHELPFMRSVPDSEMPPFPTVPTYDAKAWKFIPKNSGRDVLFWNVGREPDLLDPTIMDRIDGSRPWPKDMKAEADATA